VHFKVTINGTFEGTIHSKSFDEALKSTMLLLNHNHVIDAQVSSDELNQQMIYYSIWFDAQNQFTYEWREKY